MNGTEPIRVILEKGNYTMLDVIGGFEALSIYFEIVITGITFGLLYVIYTQTVHQAHHIDHQFKATSVQVCLNFLDRLRDEDFRKINDKIRLKEKLDLTKENNEWFVVLRFLNHFEHIAIVEHRGVIDLDNTMSFFSSYLSFIDDNIQIKKLIDDMDGQKLSYLKKLLLKNVDYIDT